MTNEQLISKYGIELNGENMALNRKPEAADFETLKANKAEIVKTLKAQKETARAEKEATRKATVEFIIAGWESYKVSIDTRKNIDDQLAKIADHYKNDTTLENVKEAYLAKVNAKEQDRKEAEEYYRGYDAIKKAMSY